MFCYVLLITVCCVSCAFRRWRTRKMNSSRSGQGFQQPELHLSRSVHATLMGRVMFLHCSKIRRYKALVTNAKADIFLPRGQDLTLLLCCSNLCARNDVGLLQF